MQEDNELKVRSGCTFSSSLRWVSPVVPQWLAWPLTLWDFTHKRTWMATQRYNCLLTPTFGGHRTHRLLVAEEIPLFTHSSQDLPWSPQTEMCPKPGPAMYIGFPPHTLETSAIATLLCRGTPSSSEAPKVFTVELYFQSNRFPWSFFSVISGILRHYFKKRLQTARGWMLRLNMGLSGLMPTWPAFPWKLLHEAMGCRA